MNSPQICRVSATDARNGKRVCGIITNIIGFMAMA